MQVRILALLVAVGAVVAIDGCGDPTAVTAQFPNTDTTVVVYALNGTPTTAASALTVRTTSVVRLEAGFTFDLAFDLNSAGEVVVYTVRAVASQLAAVRRVGLQATTKTFAEAEAAPTSGYVYDSSMVVPIGKTVFVDVVDANCPQFSILGQNIRAKFAIDSARASDRTVYVHILADPNCGFKSLVQGVPKD